MYTPLGLSRIAEGATDAGSVAITAVSLHLNVAGRMRLGTSGIITLRWSRLARMIVVEAIARERGIALFPIALVS